MKNNKYRVTSFRDEIFIDEENIEEVIYRLNTKFEMMNALYEYSEEEIERLQSIIKEVREKINKAIINSEIVGNGTLNLSEILEILDKVDKGKE